jgi:hypothetical protein
MNIIEVLVPLFVFIILYPILEQIYNMLGFSKDYDTIEGFTSKFLTATYKKKGVPLDNEDKKFIDKNYKDLMKRGDKTDNIKTKKKILADITDNDIRQIKSGSNRQKQIFLKENSVSSVKKLVENINSLKIASEEPEIASPSQDKSLVEDTTKTKIISEENNERLDNIENRISKFGTDNELRISNVESQIQGISSQNNDQEKIKDNIEVLRTSVETNKIDLADMKQTLDGSPSVDYVNSKVGSVETEMSELQRKYKEMRNEFQSYKNE